MSRKLESGYHQDQPEPSSGALEWQACHQAAASVPAETPTALSHFPHSDKIRGKFSLETFLTLLSIHTPED